MLRRAPVVAMLASLVFAACGARTALWEETPTPTSTLTPLPTATVPPDYDAALVPPPDDAGPDAASAAQCLGSPPPEGVMDCRRIVQVDTLVRSDPFCFVDTVVTVGATGVLTYACAGGPARIVIGTRSFDGWVDGDHLETCSGTQFLFGDGCMWNSAQHISGSLAARSLAFSYAEAPAPGQAKCSPACSATGQITIQ